MAERRTWLRMPAATPTQGLIGIAPPPPTPGGAGGSVSSVGLLLPPDVFSITDSPVIGVGVLTGSFIEQNAHYALLGPASGVTGIPSFRPIYISDIAGVLAGDVTGYLSSNRVERIWNRPVDSAAPSVDDVFRWDGTQWQVYPGLFGVGATNRVTYWTGSNRVGSTPAFQFDGSSVMSLGTNFINGPVRIETQNTVSTGTGTAEVRALNNAAAGIALRVSGSATSTSRFGTNMANWGRLESDGTSSGLMIGVVNRRAPIAFGIDSFEVARFECLTDPSYTTSYLYDSRLRIYATTTATALGTGSFVTSGGASIAENLWIGGMLHVAGTADFASLLTTAPSGGFRLTPGVTPATMVDGLVWLTDLGMFARVNGTTFQLTASNITGSGLADQVTFWNGTTTMTGSTRYTLSPSLGSQQWVTNSHDWVTLSYQYGTIKTRIRYDDRAFEIIGNNTPGAGNSFGSGCDTTFVGWGHPSWVGSGPGFTPVFKYGMNYEVGRHQFWVGEDVGTGAPAMQMPFSIGRDFVQVHAGTLPNASSATTGGLRVSTGMGVVGQAYFGSRAQFIAATTGSAPIRIPMGVDPSVGNLADGDLWTTTLGVYVRLNGSTIQLVAAAGSLSGSGAANQVTFWSGVISITGDTGFTYLNSLASILSSSNAWKGFLAQTSATGAGATVGFQAKNSAGTVIAHAGVWTGPATAQLDLNSARFMGEGTALTRVQYGIVSPSLTYTAPIDFKIGETTVATFTGRGIVTYPYDPLGDVAHGLRIYYTADSSSYLDGSINTQGGLYVGKTLRIGTLLQLPASTAGRATFNLPHGVAPSAPVDGDMWSTTLGFYVRANGSTFLISPTGVLTGIGATNQVAYWGGSSLLQGNAGFVYTPLSGIIHITHTTSSTGPTTGSFVVDGGAGFNGSVNVNQYLGVGIAAGSSGALDVQYPSTRVATFWGSTTDAEIDIRRSVTGHPNVKFGISNSVAYLGSFSGDYSPGTVGTHLDIYTAGVQRMRVTAFTGSLQFAHTTNELSGIRVDLWHGGSDILWAVQRNAQSTGTFSSLGRWRMEQLSDRLAMTIPDATLGDRYYTTESRTLSGAAKVLTATHNDGRFGIARLPTTYRFEAEDGQPVAWLNNTYNGDNKVNLILQGTTITTRQYTGIRFTNDLYTTGWGADIMAKDDGSFKTSLLFYTNQGTTSLTAPVLSLALQSDGTVQVYGKLLTVAATATNSGINVAPGIDPTAPVNGDFWITATGVYARVAGATVNLTGGGGGGGSGAAGQVTVWSTPTLTAGSAALTFVAGLLHITDAASAELRWTNSSSAAGTATIGVATPNVSTAVQWQLRSYDASNAVIANLVTVTFAGVVTLLGGLSSGGAISATGNATFGGTLAATGNATLGGTLDITGNTTVGGTLAVTGDVSLITKASMPLLHLNPGSAPGTPLAGDVWATTTDMFIRLGGVSRQITGGVIGSGTINTLTYWNTASSIAAVGTVSYDSSGGQLLISASSTPEALKLLSAGGSAPVGIEYQIGPTGQRWVTGVDVGALGWLAGAGFFTIRDRTAAINRLTIAQTNGAFTFGSDATATSSFAGSLSVTGLTTFSAATTARPTFHMAVGADTTTLADGDFWLSSTGLYLRFNGATINLTAASGGALTDSAFTMPTNRLLGRTSGGSGSIETITVGSGLLLSGGILVATGGGGGGGSSGSANIWTALNTFTGGVFISGAPYLQLDDILSSTNPSVPKGTLFVNTGLTGGVITGFWYSGGATNYQIPGMNAANLWTAANAWSAATTFNSLSTFTAGLRISGSTYLLIDSIGGASNPSPAAGTLFVNFGATGASSGLFFATNTAVVQVGALETNNLWTGSNTFNGSMTPAGPLALGSSFSPSVTTWDASAGGYTIPSTVHILINSAAGTTAAATVTFPTTPAGRAQILICAGGFAITALTLAVPGGYTILGATTTLAVGASCEYILNGTVWTKVR